MKSMRIWFVTGTQHLYGEEVLTQVAENSKKIVEFMRQNGKLPAEVVWKEPLATGESVTRLCREANADPECVGVVAWMHTFSPAKMWLQGMRELAKPLCQFHTQFHKSLPWNEIDMDYMNLHQSAHGDREFGFALSRLRKNRHIVVGHWQDAQALSELASWISATIGVAASKTLKIARFGDNMREVAVTEGDKVEAQIQLGWSVHGYALSDLDQAIARARPEADRIVQQCLDLYDVSPELAPRGEHHQTLVDEAAIEAGLALFLREGDFGGFTDTFENLGRLPQLPGLAVQRLMQQGYGFAGEGDWKTAALLRCIKLMGQGRAGGTSFMEDYTYHLEGEGAVLGAHMLEVCPSISGQRPKLSVCPLSIGGRKDPVRLIFTAEPGRAVLATLVDMGNRFRMIVNQLDVLTLPSALPHLPVAHAYWRPEPDLKRAAAAWMYAGGAHHSCFSQVISAEELALLASMWGIEYCRIDATTDLFEWQQQLRWNDLFYSQMFWAQQRSG